MTSRFDRRNQFDNDLLELAADCRRQVRPVWERIEEVAYRNLSRVLAAFRELKISESDLGTSTGYGYGDTGRDRLEELYARAFEAETALVRPQIVSGTHAIALGLYGLLRPGDELLATTGRPYDTLAEVIGILPSPGSVAELGVSYREVELSSGGAPELEGIANAVGPRTKVAFIQRSRGYAWRPALSVKQVGEIVRAVKAANPATICLVDNCYGEFVSDGEPTAAGADLIAGSLIKNPGGGLAPTGGYIAGLRDLVEAAATRLTCPGLGRKVGPSLGMNRLYYQGLFLAPHVVGEALKGAVFAALLFERLGLEVSPRWDEERSDLIQGVRLRSPEAMVAFCRGLQGQSPIDSHVSPEPSGMPGYADSVVMAGGTFVQGSTIELSADGPLRPPYAVYLQGGLCTEHAILGALAAAQGLRAGGHLGRRKGGK